MSELISVITLTHNKLEVTRRCLPGLLAGSHAPLEIVVVDNGSTDGTVEWLAAFAKEARNSGVKFARILNKKNAGCSTARNQALEKARGTKIVFADNDVTLRSRNWLQTLSQTLEDDACTAMAGPKLVYPRKPYDIQFAGGAVSKSGRVQFIGRGESNGDPRFNKRCEVQWFASACLMVRKAVLDDVGGFDEAFNPVQFEDTDLCYRVRSRGYRIVYEPSAEMYHFESTTTAGTEAVPNAALVIRHGLLFKERWRYMFSKENGPPDPETAWRKMPPCDISTIGQLPVTGG
ncbi:MAG: hypothetical protein C0404_08060 [Verrucomicrobia bacterium]|nr:hypothetical protein [Verrucomicrobiota bacterium]